MSVTLVPFRAPEMFDDFRREAERLVRRFSGSADASETYYTPLCNVAETDTHYDISVDLPGVVLEDVDVELRHGELWITGERKFAVPEGATWHRYECPYGRFQRVIRLSSEVDMDKVDAEFRNGVLHITVPKAESAKPRHIEIRG